MYCLQDIVTKSFYEEGNNEVGGVRVFNTSGEAEEKLLELESEAREDGKTLSYLVVPYTAPRIKFTLESDSDAYDYGNYNIYGDGRIAMKVWAPREACEKLVELLNAYPILTELSEDKSR